MKTAPFRNQLGFWAFALLATCAVGACGSDDHDHEEGKASGATCPPGNTLTYENFGQKFMTDYCTRCHSSTVTGDMRKGAPADHNFDKFAGIFVMAEHIDEHAAAGPNAVNTAMPPDDGAKPTEEERRKLGQWLACETSDDDGGGGNRGDSGGTQTDGGRDSTTGSDTRSGG